VIFHRRWAKRIASLLLISLFFLSTCQATDTSSTPQVEEPVTLVASEKLIEPTGTEPARATETETHRAATEVTQADIEKTETAVNPLPPEPIEQSFQTSDGITLSGTFYPARTIDAPLVVLFHWARGDQSEWAAIAPWLQNRGLLPNLDATGQPWLDASWFPAMPEEASFNVFTFTFRGCEGGCQIFDREGWLLDIEAAMAFVAGLENVDLSRVATMGASIGGDGAAYACHVYNTDYGGCRGALSLSPGGYLTFTYAQEVANLASQSPPIPAWCLYSIGDGTSAQACEAASGEGYRKIAYPDSAHGLALLEPNRDPNPLDLTLDFLNEIGLCPSCMAITLEAPMTYEVIHVFPHDPLAFTQGLIYLDGFLYESTGLYGQSSLRKVALETGEVLQQVDLGSEYFAEGLTAWEDTLIQLTWRKGIGFVYQLEDFSLIDSFTYETEGWGLTHDGERLIMSDGTSKLYFLDPQTYQVTGSVNVTDQGEDITRLNELEYIRGEVFANIWQTDDIARIDPTTGDVLGWIDLSGLLPEDERTTETDVLNGIAYDTEQDRLFVTGKFWPKLFEIRLVPVQ
jgi:glutamine cyclotransferase/dienelactone hydrolase